MPSTMIELMPLNPTWVDIAMRLVLVIAAGALMVTEAGGIVGEFNGESDYLYKGDIIAASPKIFGQMVGLLTPFV